MLKEAVFHQTGGAYAYSLAPNVLRIRLRTKKGDLIKCRIWHADRYTGEDEQGEWVDGEKVASDELFDYYEAIIPSETKRIKYAFYLESATGETIWFGELGFATDKKGAGVFQFSYIHQTEVFQTPDWCKEGVIYQIFPERFANGNSTNDPADVEEWSVEAQPTRNSFFGGDLQGIIDHLDHLERLGVSGIYLTPIFLSTSHHKYDTADYYQIDPQFGEFSTFKQLVQAAHDRGIRVILDAVFNHSGDQFFAFQDVLKYGERSRYKDWFHIRQFPVVQEPKTSYETFFNNVKTMPKLNTEHPEVRHYLLRMVRFWMEETEIDGWRLDVANEVDHRFWREFRKVVKEINPDALIVGEIWHDSSAWLEGDQFDSVMNYLFREGVLRFFATNEIDANKFDAELTKARMIYKEQATQVLWNLLDSHDTERFLTSCKGREEKLRLAVLFQLTYVGTPLVYYGDEVGMVGETDPDCRRPMIWEEEQQNQNLLQYYQKLIRIRRTCKALTCGNFRTWSVNSTTGLYAYTRSDEQETVGVVLNNRDQEQTVHLPITPFGKVAQLEDLLESRVYKIKKNKIQLTLAPYQGVCLRVK